MKRVVKVKEIMKVKGVMTFELQNGKRANNFPFQEFYLHCTDGAQTWELFFYTQQTILSLKYNISYLYHSQREKTQGYLVPTVNGIYISLIFYNWNKINKSRNKDWTRGVAASVLLCAWRNVVYKRRRKCHHFSWYLLTNMIHWNTADLNFGQNKDV